MCLFDRRRFKGGYCTRGIDRKPIQANEAKWDDARLLKSPDKFILEVLGHQHIIRCNTCLTSIDDFAPQNPLRRCLQIARRINDHGRFAFETESVKIMKERINQRCHTSEFKGDRREVLRSRGSNNFCNASATWKKL